MPVKDNESKEYEGKGGIGEKGLGEKSIAILEVLNSTGDMSDLYTVKEVADGLKEKGITEKNVYVNRTLCSLVKRKKGAYVQRKTHKTSGKTVFGITELGQARLQE